MTGQMNIRDLSFNQALILEKQSLDSSYILLPS